MEKIDIVANEVCKRVGFIDDDQKEKEVVDEAIE